MASRSANAVSLISTRPRTFVLAGCAAILFGANAVAQISTPTVPSVPGADVSIPGQQSSGNNLEPSPNLSAPPIGGARAGQAYPFGGPSSPIGLAPPGEGVGRGWTLIPSIGGRVTASDNVRRTSENETPDMFFEIFPGLALNVGTPRLRLQAAYVGQKAEYMSESDLSRWANNLAASATLAGIEDFFFVDASASITQQFFSAFGARPQDVSGDYSNRFESRSASISPYIRSSLGPNIPYWIRYNHVWTRPGSNSIGLPGSETDQVLGHIQGPLIGNTLGWSLDYNNQTVDWDNQPRPQKNSRYTGTLYYQYSPEFTPYALGGRESNNYRGPTETSTNWGGGFTWRPSGRTFLDARAERRFFGTGWSVQGTHRHRDVAFNLVVTRDVSIYQSRLFAIPAGDVRFLLDAAFTARYPDPVQRTAAVNQAIAESGVPPVTANATNFFSQRVSLERRVEPSIVVLGARNSLTFAAFWREVRPIDAGSTLSSEDLSLFTDARLYGASTTWTHRLTGTTSLTARVGRSITKAGASALRTSGARTTQDDLTATLVTLIGPRTQGYLGFRVQRFDSTISTDFVERAIFTGFAHTFN